jgi:heterodisulfide reductase subunit C
LRHDLFFHRKSVHVKLTKEVHTSLREKLFRHGITMQDLFQEAAEMVLLEGSKSDKFLEKISKKKLMVSIEKINRRQNDQLGELDSDTLYNLLEDSNDDEANTEG